MLKKIFLISVLISPLFISSVLPVRAESATASAAKGERLEVIKARCDSDITKRLTTLTELSTRLDSAKRLTDSQKAVYQNQISSGISGLNSAKAKCDSDTDSASLLADHKTVFTNYRIYAVQAPQIRLLVANDALLETIGNLETLSVSLSGLTSSSLISDMQAKIADANPNLLRLHQQFFLLLRTASTLTPKV